VNPRLQELFDYAAATRAALLETIAGLPPDILGRRPDPERWSVADNLEHLAYVERGLTLGITKWLAEGRAKGLQPETCTDSVLESLDRFGVARRNGRITAGERVRPRGELEPSEALAALAMSREALLGLYRGADGLDLTQVRAPHPALGCELDLYQWLLFLAQHEVRHTVQIKEAVEALGSTAE
jgi:uncharacterized damage-inducible protein DinB